MIDWLGARKPIEIVLLMTVVLALGAAMAEQLLVPLLIAMFDAQA